jgi:GntR family transcriptional regulator, arabinose operon transcriptional repressor
MRKPAWQVITDDLAEQIHSGKLLPGTQVTPETELATQLGVSRHTVHRAIHELQRKGLVVRQRRWGTVVAKRSVARKQRIGYLADFTSNLFQSQLLNHIEGNLIDGDRLIVATSRNDHEIEAYQLRSLQSEVDGLIIYPAEGDTNSDLINSIADSGFPLVLIDRAPRGCENLVVLTDNVSASHKSVTKLAQEGHHQIAFFGTNNDRAMSIRQRHEGYLSALYEAGLSSEKLERWVHMSLDENTDAMYQAVSDAFLAMRSREPIPTAAFCTQDWLARALILACQAEGIEVGNGFSIATYNDFGDSFFRFPSRLHRIRQQVDVISATAMKRLYAMISGDPVEPCPVLVEPELLDAKLS